MKIIKLFLPFLLLSGLVSCIEDRVQLDDISTEVAIERSIAIPILNASLVFSEVAGESYDDFELLPNGDTIYLYLIETVTYEDTLEFGEIGVNMEFDYINIYHKIRNMFPLNMDLELFMYNENLGETIDTIPFKAPGDEYFIEAPTVIDDNGLVVEDAIETKSGVISLTNEMLDNLFTNTTHLIVYAAVAETDTVVKMLGSHGIDIALGLSARGRYVTDIDSLLNPSIQ